MKTLSQYPLLVGRILERVERRRARAGRQQRRCMALERFVNRHPLLTFAAACALAWLIGALAALVEYFVAR